MWYFIVLLVLIVVIGSFLVIANKRKINSTNKVIKEGDKIIEDIISNPLQLDSIPDSNRMDNISYHGTNKESAATIVGPPSDLDINRGKGELGKGFYTGSSVALAAIWANSRYREEGVVIKFDIPIGNFIQLNGIPIKTQEKVINIWNDLKSKKEDRTYTFGYDYIIAPFATVCFGNQYKFESKKAEDELKSSNKQIYPCAS